MNNYSNAYKLGIKEYKRCLLTGEDPYLPVLDNQLPLEKRNAGFDLGLIDIPTEFIVGTKTTGRTNDFAKNFMPIADEDSEFADKWNQLCDSHLEEGIREPIVAWEYMNRFYIQEGNKRVSVLKFYDSVFVTGKVKRILPPKNEETKLYYEFLEFYKYTKINYIEFS
ncbi:MAG: BMP family ABC transporter substrate-binding protein, partial [Holdemanella sp.]|nr:BMP family ABC transporter substrate-binding protein [Holdemanella sp.]